MGCTVGTKTSSQNLISQEPVPGCGTAIGDSPTGHAPASNNPKQVTTGGTSNLDKRKHAGPNNDNNRNASQKDTNTDRHPITIDVKSLEPLLEEPIHVDGDVEIISPTKRRTNDTSANDNTYEDQPRPSLDAPQNILRSLANSLSQSKFRHRL